MKTYPIEQNNNFLKHYGVLGQKWGVITQVFNRKSTKEESKQYKPNLIDSSKPLPSTITKKNMKQLSDLELQRVINRQMLEKQYANLNKSNIEKGKEKIASILENAGTKVATKYTAKYMEQGVEYLLKKALKN